MSVAVGATHRIECIVASRHRQVLFEMRFNLARKDELD